jgi:hypothetical protein
MKTILTQVAILALVAGVTTASEEDYASITKMELTAKTTDSTFGTVVVQAETSQGQDGVGFSSLTVIAKGKTMSVPKDVLAQASRATFMTTTISSEVGYPAKGIGPFLYICFLGHDGTKQCRFRLVFDASGFKEMKKAEHPTTPRTVP